MAEGKPELVIVAGPNGAGKTTFITTYLPEFTNIREFVNADMIAKGISPFDPDAAQIEAGRIMLNRIDQFIEERRSFAVESTISGRSALQWIRKARANRFLIKLYYIYVNSSTLSIERIAIRVEGGGHNIPDDIAFRRYFRSLRNLFDFYIPLADEITIVDNSESNFDEVATLLDQEWKVRNQTLFQKIRDYSHAR